MKFTHPALVDSVNEADSFLDTISKLGLSVILENANGNIAARLTGVLQVVPPNSECGRSVSGPFVGYGDSKDQALGNLKKICSGAEYCTRKKWGFIGIGVSKPDGDFGIFPRFNGL